MTSQIGAGDMPKGDDLLSAIETVHAAGLDTTLWPDALSAVKNAVGGVAATLEVFDRDTLRHREFHSHGLPPAQDVVYLEHYSALNPRLPYSLRMKTGEVAWDALVLDEAAMDRSAFYSEFLPGADLRYWICGMLRATSSESASVSVQRSRRQGHVNGTEIAVMRSLVPHVRQALDVATRLKGATQLAAALERALDWLSDGVALLRADGTIAYANESLRAIVRRGDGVGVKRNQLELKSAEGRTRLSDALGRIARMTHVSDFAVARSPGRLPYIFSLRPVGRSERAGFADSEAVAILFVNDPASRQGSRISVLQDTFGLTDTEAKLAEALRGGASLGDYARERRISINTVYTHLRRIKEKTGAKRLSDLISRLNGLQNTLLRV